jgi:hypothetical protein
MPHLLFGNTDEELTALHQLLEDYEQTFPGAQTSYYRRNNVSIRLRVIDPSFQGLTQTARSERVEGWIEKLPDEIAQNITLMLLYTPQELTNPISTQAFSNLEFEQPTPSLL